MFLKFNIIYRKINLWQKKSQLKLNNRATPLIESEIPLLGEVASFPPGKNGFDSKTRYANMRSKGRRYHVFLLMSSKKN